MSYRNTYITEFLYRYNKLDDLAKIREKLDSFGTVEWYGDEHGMGYFHGRIKGLYYNEIETQEKEITDELLKLGVRIKIVHETPEEDFLNT